MESHVYDIYSDLEATHWWFEGRRRLLRSLLARFFPARDKKLRIYDVGCGTGANLWVLKDFGEAIGIDDHEEAMEACRTKGLGSVIKGNICRMPMIQTGSADLVLAADVLEHLEDDGKGIAEVCRILKKGGLFIILVPAFMILWAQRDEESHHFRRYRRKELLSKLENAGFKPLRTSYFNFFLFVPILIVLKIMTWFKIRQRNEFGMTTPLLNTIFTRLLTLEVGLLRLTNLPFGVTLFCVARKS